MNIRSGLIIAPPYARQIADGRKTWELRSTHIHKIGETIALVEKGTLTVVGVATITDSLGPLSDDDLRRGRRFHLLNDDQLADHPNWRYAWVLSDAHPLPEPVPYEHTSGAVIFVDLKPGVVQRIQHQLEPVLGKRA